MVANLTTRHRAGQIGQDRNELYQGRQCHVAPSNISFIQVGELDAVGGGVVPCFRMEVKGCVVEVVVDLHPKVGVLKKQGLGERDRQAAGGAPEVERGPQRGDAASW